MRKDTKRRRFDILLHACGIGLFLPVAAIADATWNPAVPDGSWSNPANWLGGVVPGNGTVTIAFNDALSHIITFDDFPFNGVDFRIHNTGGGSATITFTGAVPFSSHNLSIADVGRGAAVQTANWVNTSNFNTTITVGGAAQSAGTYTQAGGLTNCQTLTLARDAGSTGTVILSGGWMLTEEAIIGNLGDGTVIQTGGGWGNVTLGGEAGGNGTYILSGGSFGLTASIGNRGSGTFIYNGGTILPGHLSLGDGAGGSGTFVMNAPSLAVEEITVGNYGAGYFEQHGSTVILGTVTQQGTLELGQSGGTGTYVLNSGLLKAGTEKLSYESRAATAFIQNAGINQPGSLLTDFGSTYALNAGSLVISNSEAIFGALLQSGGIHSVGTAAQPARLVAAGITQTGGEFLVYGTERDLGLTVHSGGVHNVGAESAPATLVLGQSNVFTQIPPEVYRLSGSGELDVVGSERLGYTRIGGSPPIFADAGQFTQSGGTHTLGTASVPGQLILQGNGTSNIERGEYLLSGGVLKVIGDEHVGVGGFGRTTQTGGWHTLGTTSVPGNLYLGEGTGRGVYALSGGTLNVTGLEWVGYNGSATFRQSGGWHSLAGTMSIGNAGTGGIYTMTGGAASLANVYVGGSPSGAGVPGTLSVASGSSLSVPGILKVWPTGTAIYSGGSVSAGSLNVPGGRVLLTPGADKVLHVRSVATSSGGIIDLADNSLVVDYGSPLSLASLIVGSPIDDVVTQLGSGIITSISATNPNKRLGCSDDGSKITVLLALGGDSNLDGIVNTADLQLLDNHWQQSGYWGGGDFDYTKFVDIQDLYILAPNWNDPTPLSDALASLGLPQVPEPASLLGVFLLAFTRGRSRRC